MIVKIVHGDDGGYGRSFQGLVRYIAHDADQAQTTERVTFTSTRNLPTKRSEVAWRVMAATALNRDKRMLACGFKPRHEAKGEVMHVVLSWDASEKEALTKAEMLRAAEGALKHLGLHNNQCFMAAHEDRDCPHLHLACSRVDPETGKIVSAWRSKKNLSRWALSYERGRGQILVKERERAWLARDNGIIPPKAKKTTSKDQYELEKAVKRLYESRRTMVLARRDEDDPRARAELRAKGVTLRAQHRAAKQAAQQRLELARATAIQKARHADQAETFFRHHRHRLGQAKEAGVDRKRLAKRRIERATVRLHERLQHKHAAEAAGFERAEAWMGGQLYNRLKYADWRALWRDSKQTGRAFLTQAYNAMSDAGYLKAQMAKRQQDEIAQLHQRRKTMDARREVRISRWVTRQSNWLRIGYARKLRALENLQEQSRERLKAAWGEFNGVRRGVTQSAREAAIQAQAWEQTPQPKRDAKQAFGVDASELVADGRKEGRGEGKTDRAARPRRERRPRTKREDILPPEGSDDAARLIDEQVERMEQRKSEAQQKRGRGRKPR